MDLSIQVTLGKSVQSSHTISDNKNCWVIGNSENADVRLDGDRILPSHCKIVLENNRWKLVSDQGAMKHTGELIDSIEVNQKLSISIGPYLLKLMPVNPVGLANSERDDLEVSDSELEIKHSRILVDRFKTASKLKQLFKFRTRSSSNQNNASNVKTESTTRRRLLLVGLLIITWSVVALKSCSPETEESSKMVSDNLDVDNTEDVTDSVQVDVSQVDKAITLDEKRVADRYIQWADQLYQEGQLEQAYLRLQAGFQKIPNHIEIRASLEKLRGELIDTYRASRQFDKALALIDPLKSQGQKYALLYEEISVERELSNSMLTRAAKAKQALSQIADEYEQLLNENKFAQANQLLSNMDVDALSFDTALMQKYNTLIQAAEHRRQIYEDKRIEQQKAQQNALHASQSAFSACVEFTQKGDFKSAYDACNKVERLAPENYDNAEVNMWLTYLDEKRFEDSRALLRQAESCYTQDDFNCAFDHWQRVLEIDPENTQVVTRFDQAVEAQTLVAQRLYKTAKAYEDLGQINQAKAELTKLMQQLPLENQQLYKKAVKLLDSLEQY